VDFEIAMRRNKAYAKQERIASDRFDCMKAKGAI
jgi:hypothetical protein